jgi:hypothetical protein
MLIVSSAELLFDNSSVSFSLFKDSSFKLLFLSTLKLNMYIFLIKNNHSKKIRHKANSHIKFGSKGDVFFILFFLKDITLFLYKMFKLFYKKKTILQLFFYILSVDYCIPGKPIQPALPAQPIIPPIHIDCITPCIFSAATS